MQDVIRQLQKLLEEFPDYVIIGGIAASLLGAPRTTIDVDIVLILSPADVERAVRICQQQGFEPGRDAVNRIQAGRAVKFTFGQRFSIDLRMASFRLDYAAIQRATAIPLFGYPLRIATPEDLIVYKLARWEAIDREDVRHLVQVYRESLDSSYIETQARWLEQEADLPGLVERWHSLLGGV